ncbi:hypothetical protein COF68_06095 [Bacillus toyonensis]|uniref:hypothetical protein n=1 Tax=Bacillus toyonensis TaxID=155322 RepID=UPI000BFE7272|nr:hypothetical protein [Bacillus toyonensis]PHE64405.1 hypothetical protein COF68_06095 [Bacillus toyonensis]
MTVMNIEHAYDELKYEVSKHTKALFFDKDFYLVGIATSEESLSNLVSNKRSVGVVCDGTSKGNLVFTINNENSEETPYKTYRNGLEFALQEAKSNISSENELALRMKNNSTFVMIMGSLTNENVDLDAKLEHTVLKENVHPLHAVIVKVDNLKLSLTDMQMSFLTSYGVIKIHDSNKDVESEYIIKLLSSVLRIKKTAVEEALNKMFENRKY